MIFRCPAAGLVLLALALVGCRPASAPLGDAEMAACIPSDTVALAGVHLDRVRTSPLFQKFGAGKAALLDPFRDASYLLLAYNGKDLLLIARGSFQSAPAGAILLTPRLALAGSPAAVRAATAQHARNTIAAPGMTGPAESVAAQPVWAVFEGGRPLPLTGNLTNLNRLLGSTQYVTLAAELNTSLILHLSGVCQSPDAAQALEGNVRSLSSLAATAVHNPEVATLLKSMRLQRDGNTLHVDLTAGPAVLQQLIDSMQ